MSDKIRLMHLDFMGKTFIQGVVLNPTHVAKVFTFWPSTTEGFWQTKIRMSNGSEYTYGQAVWSGDSEKAKQLAEEHRFWVEDMLLKLRRYNSSRESNPEYTLKHTEALRVLYTLHNHPSRAYSCYYWQEFGARRTPHNIEEGTVRSRDPYGELFTHQTTKFMQFVRRQGVSIITPKYQGLLFNNLSSTRKGTKPQPYKPYRLR